MSDQPKIRPSVPVVPGKRMCKWDGTELLILCSVYLCPVCDWAENGSAGPSGRKVRAQ